MYKITVNHQISFFDFNQSCGMQLDMDNEWVRRADQIDWKSLESLYAEMFPSHTGHPAKPFRMAFGAIIIQKKKQLSDRKLTREIAENPYLQYFIGLDQFTNKSPFEATSLVAFRKRMDANFLMRANEIILKNAGPTNEHKTDPESDDENIGTFILDATCSPSNIRFPQDFVLLDDAREKLEEIIDYFHKTYHPWDKPRTYRRVMHKEYLALAKTRKRSTKKIRSLIRKELGCLNRDMRYINAYMDAGYSLPKKYSGYFQTIQVLYEQQKYMFDNHTHRVENRIVSIHQPYIRPVVRGKAKTPTEFGAKYDVSIDSFGHARLEELRFDPYNESTIFQDAVERYRKRTGHYPVRVLVDQIYRTKANRSYCKEHGIRMSGPKLGRPAKDHHSTDKIEKQDNADRIEVERFFSLEKRCYGAGLIMEKLEETTLASIALSVLVTNLFSIPVGNLFLLYFSDVDSEAGQCYFMEFFDTDDAA